MTSAGVTLRLVAKAPVTDARNKMVPCIQFAMGMAKNWTELKPRCRTVKNHTGSDLIGCLTNDLIISHQPSRRAFPNLPSDITFSKVGEYILTREEASGSAPAENRTRRSRGYKPR